MTGLMCYECVFGAFNGDILHSFAFRFLNYRGELLPASDFLVEKML